MASFSRLQLAAALIEYDNDPDDPEMLFRSAHESAIFAHLRRIPPLPPQRRKSVDYLSVALPGDDVRESRAESVPEHSASPAEMLNNPFGRATVTSDILFGEDEEGMEVDLASWGLDTFIPKEKDGSGKKHKGKEKVKTLPNPHATTQASYRSTRSMSLGNIDSFGTSGVVLDPAAPETRRRSLGSTLERGNYQQSYRSPPRHDAIDRIAAIPPHSIPFPVLSVRSASPGPNDGLISPSRERAQSRGSMGSLLAEAEEKPNPFAVDPPTPAQASRFDPKARARTMSVGTMGSVGSRYMLAEDIPRRSMSPSSRLDLTHARTLSNASMLRDNDGDSFMGGMPAQRQNIRDRPYSTLELMRPKVLVMPSPLQGLNLDIVVPKAVGREGFEITTDGPPLPHGARSNSGYHLSSGGPIGEASGSEFPIASNSFTPNPRANLTLSQLTFRNTLKVGGQRDIAYADIDTGLRRATEEGEQVIEEFPEEEPARPVTVVVDEPEATGRPPGKLYGRSLVDELEHRKAFMRSKQRVFTGDDRPSMMARGPMQRPSTLIDPNSLRQRPVSQNLLTGSETRPNLARKGSLGGKPLLNFDDDRSPGLQTSPNAGRVPARSVFGVDTLWEREMTKLKEIEAQEAEEQRQQEATEVARSQKKSRKKRKGKEKSVPQDVPIVPVEEPMPIEPEEPTTRSVIQRGITRGPPPPPKDYESDSTSELSDVEAPQPRDDADGWHSGESDNEAGGPVRTTGVGPRYPNRGRRQPTAVQSVGLPGDEDDSEEDMPLAATVSRAVQRATHIGLENSDSDEEKPLSQLLARSKIDLETTDHLPASATPGHVAVNGGDDNEQGDDDDDDKPLGLRVSRFIPPQSQLGSANAEDGDDDDRPLAFHPEQQRRTQYNLILQQQQQQQQQLLIQAQIQQNIMFSTPSLMGSGFFGAPALPQVMPFVPQAASISPTPGAPDTTKFGRVDRWRREIVGGGQP